MKNTCPIYIVFQVLVLLLVKICKMQPSDLLFLVVFTSFYICRYHFSQIFRIYSTLIERKIFVMDSPFLTDSPKPPHPLHNENLLSVTKVFC